MSSKGIHFILLFVLSVSFSTGCRSNKFAFSDASPKPMASAYAAVEPQSSAVSAQSTEVAQTSAAAYPSLTDTNYSPIEYSPTSSGSSTGCTSGCCSH